MSGTFQGGDQHTTDRPVEHGNEQFKNCHCSEIQIDKLKKEIA